VQLDQLQAVQVDVLEREPASDLVVQQRQLAAQLAE
jgi:hypothetical protein